MSALNDGGVVRESTEEKPIILEGDHQLEDEITLLAGQLNAGECRFLKLIGEFDQRLGWAGAGIKSCAHWLNWKCGISMGTAREKIRSARALLELPEINEAFEKGELSYSKVRAMTRVATPENENYLMMIAKHGTAQHMDKLVKQYKRVQHIIDIEEPEREDRDQRERRDVFYFQEDDGMWNITARLPAEEGGIVIKALNAIVKQLKVSALNEVSSSNEEGANSESGINEGMRSTGEKSVPAETFSVELVTHKPLIKQEDPPSISQLRADALGALAEHFLASGHSDKPTSVKSLKGAERCQLILYVKSGFASASKSALKPVVSASGHACGCGCDSEEQQSDTLSHLDGHWLPPEVTKRLACDASFLLVEEDDAGNVLDIGRRSRIISPAMARALSIRDGGCQFPGCCNSLYVEGHHIQHWADGGETKMENLVTLCRYHHQELHRGSYFLTLSPKKISATQKPQAFADRLVFTSGTNGYVIPRNPVNFTSSDCEFSKLKGSLPDSIDTQTAVCHWTGEHMDYGMAIDGLLQEDRPGILGL